MTVSLWDADIQLDAQGFDAVAYPLSLFRAVARDLIPLTTDAPAA